MVTLGEWRKRAVALYGEDSLAVAFLDEKIKLNGEDDEVFASDPQMLLLLHTLSSREGKAI